MKIKIKCGCGIIGLVMVVLLAVSLTAFAVMAQQAPDEDTDYDSQINHNTYKIAASADGYVGGEIPRFDATSNGDVIVYLYPASTPTATTVPPGNWGGTEPPGSDTTSRNAGGTAGGIATPTPEVKSIDISIDKRSIAIGHIEGQKTRINEAIKIKNIGTVNVDLNTKLQGSDELSVNPLKLSLNVKQEKTIYISGEIAKLKVGAYPVKVIITSSDGKINKEVIITITVAPQAKLFDLTMGLSAEKKAIFAGEEIPLNITVTNIAGVAFDAKIQYNLKDFSNKLLFTDDGSISGSPVAVVSKNIKTSSSLQSGNYLVEARIINKGETVATAVLTVFINGKEGKNIGAESGGLLTIVIVMVIIIVVFTVGYLKRGKLMSLLGRGEEGDLYEK